MNCHYAFDLRVISSIKHYAIAEYVLQDTEGAVHFVLLEQFGLDLQANGFEVDRAMKERA